MKIQYIYRGHLQGSSAFMALGLAVHNVHSLFKKAPLTTYTREEGKKTMVLQELSVFLDNYTLMSNIKKRVWNHRIALTIIYRFKKYPKYLLQ